ncbi:hybrid sensor histidine kinase/response regulator [bacterium]|nr:hybrid sensor histidine kinase/response regulator [bacterium]
MSKNFFCVLDDEKDFLTVAEGEFKKYLPDMEGVFTTDPDVAVNLVLKGQPLIFVIDVKLGGDRTGMEIYQRICAVTKKAGVIFITGNENFVNNEDVRSRILLEGSIDLMEKPIRWQELAIKIKNNMKLLLYQCDLENRVAERTQQLIHADRLATVGTMVSAIIHEISSPLTFIKANQEMCRYAFDNVKKVTDNKEVLSIFESLILPSVEESMRGIVRIEELLQSFRRFYKRDDTASEVDFSELIAEVKNLTYYNIKRENISFLVEIDKSAPKKILCKKQELIQVVTNIVNNAVDAFEESDEKSGIKGEKELKIFVSGGNNLINIVVSNNGPAIPKDVFDRMFEPFFTTKKAEKGTGLGLSIARQILKFMGGTIYVENRSKKHPTVDFIITIPITYNA